MRVRSKQHVFAAALMAIMFACFSTMQLAALNGATTQNYEFSELNIAPGADGESLNFAWLSQTAQSPTVQIARKIYQVNDEFPVTEAQSFTGTVSQMRATQFNTNDQSIDVDTYSNKVTVTDLDDSTDYVYRVGNGSSWSEPCEIKTHNQNNFGFFVVGDPQLGAKATGPKTLASDMAGWKDTVNKATATYPNASFLISLGDEVNDYNALATQENEYEAYFSPSQFRSLPMATINGNHDFQMGEYYGYHYNQPNLSTKYGTSYGNDGDYWFVYGNVLFLMLNSNTESIATHDIFIRSAVAKNPNVEWRVACLHHSIYSEADHYADPDIIDRRSNFPTVFERYNIDVVLQGHDHSYTRTFPMKKGKPVNTSYADTIENPEGIIYFTFNSGSGSKFYDWKDSTPEVFSAARWQGKVPSFTYIGVNGNTFKVMTYRTDDMSMIDSCTITKTK